MANRGAWLLALAVLAAALPLPLCLSAQTPGQTTVGRARFTVVTPTLIRLEYAPDGRFVDLPSWFAAERPACDPRAHIVSSDKSVEIDTGQIRLTYHEDGKPFSAANLRATIKCGDGETQWTPGLSAKGNLGGTISTLDLINGAVPLGEGLLARDGWFLLDDSRSPLFSSDWITLRPGGDHLDWYLFGYGLDYRAAFRSFTAVGGTVPLPRKYTLGSWYSRYWSYSADDFKQIVQEYEAHGFPLDVLVMDMDWHPVETNLPNIGRGYANLVWTGYTWNKQLIPDPPGLLRSLHGRGIAVTLNDHPADGIQPTEEAYPGYMHALGRDPAAMETVPFDAGSKAYLDTFFRFSHQPREQEGVDFWWLDWQQAHDTRSLPGLTNLQALNFYYYQHSRHDGLRGQSFSRWAGWGDHRYPIHFSGDAFTRWAMLRAEVPFTSTGGNVGCFFWSHDIGGHQGGRNEESYTRWCQFGALSAALRSHSMRDPAMDRRPWTYPDWAEASMRRSYRLRAELMPYLYTSIEQATRDSVPFLRPLYVDHPQTEAAYHNGQEYTFGDHLLVAPVTQPGVGTKRVATQSVWFPEGDWYDFFNGEKFTGPTRAVVADGIDTFPLYVRGGVPLPMQPFTPHPGTAPLTDLVLRCYPGQDGQLGTAQVYEDDGLTVGYERGERATTTLTYLHHGDEVTITASPTEGTFHGQPDKRRCVVELPCTLPLASCSLPAANPSYDPDTFTNRLELPELPVRQGWTVTVRVAEAPPATVAQRAAENRLHDLLGEPYATWQAEHAPVSEAMQTAIDAARGVALVGQNEHPYLLGSDASLLFCRNHQSAGEAATVKIGQAPATPVFLTPGGLVPDSPAPKGLPVGLAPVEVTLGDGTVLRASVRVSVDAGRDLAPQAVVEASSGGGAEATRRIGDRYPEEPVREWVTDQQKAGAWLKLTWPQPVEVASVCLYDRPNLNDQVLGGTLEFDDGSHFDVPALPNDGELPARVTFPAKPVRWLRFTATQVAPRTENIGLAKIAVLGN